MYSVVICNDDRDCTGRSKNQNRKYSQQTSCDHSSTKSKSKTDKSICSGSAVKAGTYALYLETACENANTPVVAAFGAAVISSQNNRTFGGNNVIASASTGAATYQQFKVSKRGVAAIAVYKENSAGNVSSVTYSVQKLSGKTWKTVATGLSGAAKITM